MIQLSYQAALDPFHAVFRALRLRSLIEVSGEKPVDEFRILDFYLCFPFRLVDLRLRQSERRFKKLSSRYESAKPYGTQPSDRELFARMRPIQVAALETCAIDDFISRDRLENGWVATTQRALPAALIERTSEANAQDQELFELFGIILGEYGMLGPNGLKGRSGLLETRYDAV